MTDYASLAAGLGILGSIHGDELRARCPLHTDQNPSFSMNIHTGQWTCFAKDGSGGFRQLVERVLGYGWQEAADWISSNGKKNSVDQLSRQLAIELCQVPGAPARSSEAHWGSYFFSLPVNTMPLWFLNRGFSWPSIQRWGIRYDVSQDAVVIPVTWDSELVGTITRPKEGMPKYKNSENLPRSEILFGEISQDINHIILTEGCLDALWLNQLGFNAAGLLGTYLSDIQVGLLRRLRFGEIVLALDNDEAGKEGTRTAVAQLVKGGYLLPQIKCIRFPDGIKDPQECDEVTFKDLFSKREDINGLISPGYVRSTPAMAKREASRWQPR